MQKVSMRYRCAYQATGKWGRMASTLPCRNRHRPPPKCRSRPQRRRSPRRPRMIDRCSVRVGDTQLSIYLSVYLTIYLVRAARSQRRLAACVEYKVAQTSASWLCGGSSQRHRSCRRLPQASRPQPRPVDRLGRAGQPYRHSLLHSVLPVVFFSVIVPVCWPKTITSLPSSVTSTPRKPCVPRPFIATVIRPHIMLPSLPTEVSMRVT